MALNPIRIARNMDNFSQVALAKNIGVSRPFVVRAEQGCYVEPGQVLTHYCARRLGISPTAVIEKYKAFQSSQRYETLNNKFDRIEVLAAPVAVNSNEPVNKDLVFNHQLFSQWRESYWNTVTQFSIDMCVHPYSVSHYEDGDMYGMPSQLINVLTECKLLDPNFNTGVRWYYAAA